MERKFSRGMLTAVMFIAAQSTAYAAETGFYIGATASRADHDVKGEDGILVGFGFPRPGTIVTLRPDRVDIDAVQPGWSATLGYRVNQYVAAEVSYHDFGEAEITERYSPAFLFPLPAEIVVRSTVQASGPALAVLGLWPVTPSLDVFARGGVLFVDEKVERQIDSFRSGQTVGDEVVMAGVGAQWSFASRWSARLEYQRTGSIDYGIDIIDNAGTRKIEQFSLSVLFNL